MPDTTARRQNEVGGDDQLSDDSAALPRAPAQGTINRYSLRSKGPVSPVNVGALRVMALAVSNSNADVTIPRSFAEAMRTRQAMMWKDAMSEEMNSIVSKDTFVWEPRPRN